MVKGKWLLPKDYHPAFCLSRLLERWICVSGIWQKPRLLLMFSALMVTVSSLPPADQAALEEGIVVRNDRDLQQLLEDYLS